MSGFWKYAQADPDYLAIVDPDGTEHRAGDVLARCQPGRARPARARVAEGRHASRPCSRTARTPCTVYLAALQAGWYYVPINYRLSPPEIAYILKDSDAKAFVSHERFAAIAVGRRRRGRHPAPTRASRTAPSPASARSPSSSTAQPTTAARRPHGRRGDALHVGHHRPPEGRAAHAARRSTPTRWPSCSRSSS